MLWTAVYSFASGAFFATLVVGMWMRGRAWRAMDVLWEQNGRLSDEVSFLRHQDGFWHSLTLEEPAAAQGMNPCTSVDGGEGS